MMRGSVNVLPLSLCVATTLLTSPAAPPRTLKAPPLRVAPKATARAKPLPPPPAARAAPAAAPPLAPAAPAAAPSAPPPAPAPATPAPVDEEAKLLAEHKCGKCHDLALAFASELGDAQWKLHMKRMANRPSAAITDAQARRIHAYLKARATAR